MKKYLFLLLAVSGLYTCIAQQTKDDLKVIAYYTGSGTDIEQYDIGALTHIIYSFGHLKDGVFQVSTNGEAALQRLVALKKKYPGLKIMIALGGWGGCAPCSAGFAQPAVRESFARSVKELCDKLGIDGIDLDWEYPAIQGYEGHRFAPEDRDNFTALVRLLRKTLGSQHEISFAAGAIPDYLQHSVDWTAVMPLVDRVNLMTYDLFTIYDSTTGHHTPLYATAHQQKSIDYTVHFLDSAGVPRNKMVLGAAFYARIFEAYNDANHGLYQLGKFEKSILYKSLDDYGTAQGFETYRDPVAHAPYRYNPTTHRFITYDDTVSVREKTQYAIRQGLQGIMFWELTCDRPTNGLLEAIHQAAGAPVDL